MTEILYRIVEWIAKIHNMVLGLNDSLGLSLSDKDLHFLVIGALGIILVMIIEPLFNWLASNDHELIITWIYVTTLLVVITFAIEIGQQVTGTGRMEFADIMFGLVGFMFMFVIYALIRMILHGIKSVIQHFRKH